LARRWGYSKSDWGPNAKNARKKKKIERRALDGDAKATTQEARVFNKTKGTQINEAEGKGKSEVISDHFEVQVCDFRTHV